jgi:hypothetical protein
LINVGNVRGRPLEVSSAVVAALVATVLFAAAPANGASDAFRTYPTCLVFEKKPRSDSTCAAGDGFGAVLISRHREHIHYRFCWREPSHEHHCTRKAVAHRHRASKVPLYNRAFADPTGKWRLTWKHGGHVIDSDKLHVRSEGV